MIYLSSLQSGELTKHWALFPVPLKVAKIYPVFSHLEMFIFVGKSAFMLLGTTSSSYSNEDSFVLLKIFLESQSILSPTKKSIWDIHSEIMDFILFGLFRENIVCIEISS